jgi:PAS domain S-box-containing protein
LSLIPLMSTANKLWLGFGTLIVVLLLWSAAIIGRVASIEMDVAALANARELSAAAKQLEINTLGYALDVRAYLQTGEPRARQDATEEAAKVERHLKEYQRLARTGRQREMAARFAPLWQEMNNRGQALLDSANRQPAREDSIRFYDLRSGLKKQLDDHMQADAAVRYDANKDAVLRNVRSIWTFALVLLSAGALIAAVTSAAVGRGIVKAERLVRANRELLRTTLASIGDGVITTDAQGRVASLNAVAESLTGWNNDQAAGQPLGDIFRIINEQTRQPAENPATKVLAAGEIAGLASHTVLISKDGTQRPVDDSAAPIRDEAGKVAGVVLIFRDITARRQAEVAMKISEVRYRRLFETAKDGILLLDADSGKVTDVNPFMCTLLGYPHEQFLHKELWEIGLFKDVEASKGAMRELQTKRYIRYEDLPLETKDGRRIDVEFISNVYSEGHHPVIQCNIRDITERKLAEEVTQRHTAQFETLVNEMPLGMYLVDAALRIRVVSRKARPVFGDIGELVGRDFIEVIHILWPPASADDIVARFRQTLETGEPYSAPEFSEERYDRNVREYYDWQIHRITLPDGQYGVACYFIDISERMRLTNELRRYSADLSDANRRKDEFLALLAHELRNPLAPIRNMLEIMKRAQPTAELLEQARSMIDRQLSQLVQLVDDLVRSNFAGTK